jgi:hypothetical protein
MASALVIVDMQVHFEASHDTRTIENCVKLVKKAIQKKAPIIVLEYAGYGDTLYPILDAIGDYPYRAIMEKWYDNGGPEVLQGLESLGFQVNDFDFRLCGVNSAACVMATATYLAQNFSGKAYIHSKACNQPSYWYTSPFSWVSSYQNCILK